MISFFPNKSSILSSECLNLLYCSVLSVDQKEDLLVYSFVLILYCLTTHYPAYIIHKLSSQPWKYQKETNVDNFLTFCI